MSQLFGRFRIVCNGGRSRAIGVPCSVSVKEAPWDTRSHQTSGAATNTSGAMPAGRPSRPSGSPPARPPQPDVRCEWNEPSKAEADSCAQPNESARSSSRRSWSCQHGIARLRAIALGKDVEDVLYVAAVLQPLQWRDSVAMDT